MVQDGEVEDKEIEIDKADDKFDAADRCGLEKLKIKIEKLKYERKAKTTKTRRAQINTE
jgi:hypothetical protein